MSRTLQALVTRPKVPPYEPLLGALACVAIGTLVRLFLNPWLGNALPFATYFPVVLIATMLWGVAWGGSVLLVSGLVAAAIQIPSSNIALSDPKLGAALGLFLFSGFVILWTGQALRGAFLRLHAAHQADLLRKAELQHRLKNTLALVQSFSFAIARKVSTPAEFHELLEARVGALAAATDVLFAERFDACGLPEIAKAAVVPFADEQRISLHGPEMQLHPDCAEPLVLALHELATNAHKYGALSCPDGRVDVSWSLKSSPHRECVIRWLESGGPVVRVPVRSGLGRVLLSPQRGLKAVNLNYEPTGVSCELTVPVLTP